MKFWRQDFFFALYSSEKGRICPTCGWPARDCRCSRSLQPPDEPIPEKISARLRLETHGHAGKSVTVIDALPRNRNFLEELAQELKKACGTGGRARDGAIQLQGDLRERLREILDRKGWSVKG